MTNRPGAQACEKRHRALCKVRSRRNAREGSQRPREARRIAAAVNAVEGIPTSMLEGAVVRSLLLRHANQLLAEVPALRTVLKTDT